MESSGCFTTADVDREFNLRSRREKNLRSRVLSTLLYKENTIFKDRVQRGRYHRIEASLDFIDLDSDEPEGFPVNLPLGLNDLVNIPPKSIVVIAGTTNAGKTALLLQTASLNLTGDKPLLYLFSEMGAGEFKRRLRGFTEIPFDRWKMMKAAERSVGFHSAIKGLNPDGITFVDFLEEVGGEYFKMSAYLRDIYDALSTGIAIVAIQKASNQTFGRGGEATSEKARLYLSLDKLCDLSSGAVGALKILKAKDYPGTNPNGKEIHVKITKQGVSPLNDWAWVTPQQRESLREQYKVGLGARFHFR